MVISSRKTGHHLGQRTKAECCLILVGTEAREEKGIELWNDQLLFLFQKDR